MTYDDRATLFRGIGGDFVADSGGLGLGGGGIFGGFSISKNFSLDPYFVKWPAIAIGDALPAPSEVKMYVDGFLVSDKKLSPGDFQFLNVPLPTGFSTVSLLIIDADGSERRVEIPVYRSSALLAPGVDEFSYAAGFRREELGVESFSYGEPVVMGFHRVGITGWFTGGLRGEVDHGTTNFGPTATFTLGQFGELDTSFAASRRLGKFGYGAVVDYSYARRPFFGVLSLKYLTDDYATTASTSTNGKQTFEGRLGLGLSSGLLGSLSGSLSYMLMQDDTDRKGFSISWSRNILRDVTLRATLNGSLEQGGSMQYVGFVGANIVLGDISGSTSYENDGDSSKVSTQIQSKVPRGTGFSYSGDVEAAPNTDGDWKGKGDATVSYRAPFGIYSVSGGYSQDQDKYHYELNAAGSAVLIDSSLLLGRPVLDSFALVKIDGLPGVRVESSGAVVGSTDSKGRVLVPDLVPYFDNELSLEQKDISMDYEISQTTSFISPPYKGGGVVEFKPVRFRAAAGKLFFVENGKRTPAEYAGLEVEAEKEKITTVVGTGGLFYVDKLQPGRYHARLFNKDKEGSFELVVPQSKQTVVDVGEIDCPVTRQPQ
jgi:outer membrane usher protein